MSREIAKGERFQEVLFYVFLISLFDKSIFFKKVRHLHWQVLHMTNFKTSMKTSHLVSTDVEQAVDKYIFLDVLVCSIVEYFCEFCRILTSSYGDSKYKKRRFRNALQQNSASRLLYLLKTFLTR